MDARSLKSRLSRREFLRGATAAGAAIALGRWLPHAATVRRPASAAARVSPHRVVHAHSDEATSWDYATGWYGDYVSQTVVDEMTDLGLMTLTDTATRADAWRAIIPAYTTGQIVAIKINIINATCADDDQVIDALPQPVNSVIRGLKAIGVHEQDIWVYDVTHTTGSSEMPARLVNKITALYPNIQFHSYYCSTALGYSDTDKIQFNVPLGKPGISDRPICNALVSAAHLINMPIMKRHGRAGVTLGFKNHFGSFEHCDYVHWSVLLGEADYTPTYNGLIDIYSDSHFKDRTRLTIGDGLFGSLINQYNKPSPWSSFGNKSPNSLFFSKDPVAIDCVMYDLLAAEGGVPQGSDDYLILAEEAGLGAFEHWDAAQEYHKIDYRRALSPSLYLPVIHRDQST